MLGPGKYDAACTAAREATKAKIVVLCVVDGEHGHGFECQCECADEERGELMLVAARAIRITAQNIMADALEILNNKYSAAPSKEPSAGTQTTNERTDTDEPNQTSN